MKRMLSAACALALAVSFVCPSGAFAIEEHEETVESVNSTELIESDFADESAETSDLDAGSAAVVGASDSTSETESLSDADVVDVLSRSKVGQHVAVSGLYSIRSAYDSSLVFDVPAASMADGTALQLWSENTSPAQRFRMIPDENGYVSVVNVNSGKALDVRNGQAEKGAVVQQYEPNGTPAQLWRVVNTNDGSYALFSMLDDSLALSVSSLEAGQGAGLVLGEYEGNESQKFKLDYVDRPLEDGAYFFKNVNSGKYLDVSGSSNDSGANVQQFEGNGTWAQVFCLSYDEMTGYYTILNAFSAKSLDVAGGSEANGANVGQFQPNGTLAQLWTVKESSDGGYVFLNACGGKALEVDGRSLDNGANVQVWEWVDVSSQSWSLERTSLVEEGVFELKNQAGGTLDVVGGGTESGSLIQTYSANGTMAQKFYLSDLGNGLYSLESVKSGLKVDVAGGSGPLVNIYQDNGTDAQKWRIEPSGNGGLYLRSASSGNVLGTTGSSGSYGSATVSPAAGAPSQRWSFVDTIPIEECSFVVHSSKNPSYVLEIRNGSIANGALAQIYQDNGTAAQSFTFKCVDGKDVYCITNVKSRKSLDLKDWDIDPNTGAGTVQQWETESSAAAQQWRASYLGGGEFSFFSLCGDGSSCLDVSSGNMVNMNDVGVYRANGTAAQRWKLVLSTITPGSEGSGSQEPSVPNQGGSTEYVDYFMTLDQMTSLQMSNEYVTAARDEVKNALDPNYATTGSKYQFADLREYSGMTADQLDAYIDSTSSGRNGMLHGMGYAFVNAAKTYGVNEVYLLAHAIIESGWGTSTLACGYYYDGTQDIEGKYYSPGTYYNFYGIGAYDSSPLSGGRSLAIQNGWNSPEKAIVGAAQWIASNYTYRTSYSQPTLYDMKWDVQRSEDTLQRGWHQYATDIYWARSIARVMDEIYQNAGVSNAVDFIIPRYAS